MRSLAAMAMVLVACGGGGSYEGDAAVQRDGAQTDAAGSLADGGAADSNSSLDGARAVDAAPDATPSQDAAPDFDAQTELVEHVHIYIDNFCQLSVDPMSFTVAEGQTLQLSYHNHSVDYAADVWKSYGGGFLDLATGATWNEQYIHCAGPIASTAYADIDVAGSPGGCPGFRLYINCL